MIVRVLYGVGNMNRLFSKINVSVIVSDHFQTLKDFGHSSISIFDIFIFFVLPILLSVLLVLSGFRLTTELVGLLITAFSIFAGLLFNLLILMFDIIGKVSSLDHLPDELQTKQAFTRKITILQNVSYNISFEILICLSGVILLALTGLPHNEVFGTITSLLVFFVVIIFSLTLAMILRRVHGLIVDEIDTQGKAFNKKSLNDKWEIFF